MTAIVLGLIVDVMLTVVIFKLIHNRRMHKAMAANVEAMG